ncbi:unnamed protein product [Didymodactylos carnosus]|uniref:Uncharacterized protein n=1 Tax=Didymodactylos carnosus TaxID=1234261 RepID=A0A814F9T3_9BILA|nr:unnamed protein product [Didymodactylos carnosus]CAF0980290.1 unnamed protein product [Didymodactylos carnosus]CAF3575977.1 unnamed protein product [Didymodactylos carnosus]CAF3752841.1 unnamed protein product [Didymodactylos carnosus]
MDHGTSELYKEHYDKPAVVNAPGTAPSAAEHGKPTTKQVENSPPVDQKQAGQLDTRTLEGAIANEANPNINPR